MTNIEYHVDAAFVLIAVSGTLVSFCLLLFIWGYHSTRHYKLTSIEKWSMASIFLFGLSSASQASILAVDYWDIHTLILITNESAGFLWRCATISIYILFIKRLQITFNHTKYKYPSYVYHIFYLGCLLFIVCRIAMVVAKYWLFTNTNDTFTVYAIVITVISQLIDLSLSIALIVLYFRRLRSLSQDIRGSVLKQSTIISAVSKMCILSSIAIISTQVVFSYEIIYFIMTSTSNDDLYNYKRMMLDMTPCLDGIVNSICISLSFDVANGCYYRLCGCLNKICIKLFTGKQQLMITQQTNTKQKTQSCALIIDHSQSIQ